ncbi:hypothetical protein JCM10212_000342 [Sporobolomyces blumeae]
MQRFRRRSESRKRSKGKEVERRASQVSRGSEEGSVRSASGSTAGAGPGPGDATSSSAMTRSSSGTSLLPEPEDFRTSLILPHLTARFALLRGEDGQLVDYETMENHLHAQRQTGRLTAYEVDAVLAQYKLQSAFEASKHPVPALPKRKRIDWSNVDLEKAAEEENLRISTAALERSNSDERHSPALSRSSSHRDFLGAPSPVASSSNSFVSFPAASGSTTTLDGPFPSSHSPNPNQYTPRRSGGSSLFGSRIESAKMSKSLSSNSIASVRSNASSLKSRRKIAQQEQEVSRDATARDSKVEELSQASREGGDERTRSASGSTQDGEEEQSSPREAGPFTTATGELSPPALSNQQLKRISRALDSIEDELSQTFHRFARSASADDDELEEEAFSPKFDGSDDDSDPAVPHRHHSFLSVPFASPLDPTQPVSPISPITQRDLDGIDTFQAVAAPKEATHSASDDPLPSPPVSDTEPIDPFYRTIAASAPHPDPPQRALPTGASSATLPPSPPFAASVPLPTSASMSSSLHSLSRETSRESSRVPSRLSIPADRHREVSTETDATETPSSAPETPGAYSFPYVPPRELVGESSELLHVPTPGGVVVGEADVTGISDDGPFNLSLGERSELRGSEDGAETQEDQEAEGDGEGDVTALAASIPLPGGRDSLFSTSSTGSSFRDTMYETAGSDDEQEFHIDPSVRDSTLLDVLPPPLAASVPLPRSSSVASQLDTPTAHAFDVSPQPRPDPSNAARPRSVPLDQRPPNELLAVAASSTRSLNGDTSDIVLEDLVFIQEALVRAAEKKQAEQDLMRNVEDDDEGQVEAAGLVAESNETAGQTKSEDVVGRDFEDDAEFEGGDESFGPGPQVGYLDDGMESLRADTSHDVHHAESDGDEVDTEGDSSVETGLDSRKGSMESGLTSTGAFDFGDELAGLGLTSVPASHRASKRQSTRSARRKSRKSVDADAAAMLGPGSSRMETQTSQSSSSPGVTNSAITPSTSQSDAFEFSSIAASPDVALWAEDRDAIFEGQAANDNDDKRSSRSLRVSRSPGMQDLSFDNDEDENGTGDEAEDPQAEARVAAEAEAQDETARTSAELEATPAESQAPQPVALGEPLQLDGESFLRVPRNMPRRDPASTPSMLIRDVRNQATLATFALKKNNAASPPSRALSKKSVRKGSISSPQLVSGPVDMPTVPILNPDQASDSPRNKASRSKSRRDKDADAEGSKSRGFGSRFKMLLKKQSRDHLSLNGDEVTPFSDFGAADTARASTGGPPPITPPNQDTARFASRTPEFPETPQDDPTTPLARSTSPRAPTRRPPPPALLSAVEEVAEKPSPTLDSTKQLERSPITSPVPSMVSGMEGRGLTRLVSRFRGSPSIGSRGDVEGTSPRPSPQRSPMAPVADEDARAASPVPRFRTSAIKDEAFGLGLGLQESTRSPASYGASSRSSRPSEALTELPPVEDTAPLSFGRNSQSVQRTSGHPVRASTESMYQLREAAEDLGLPPDKVQELVDSAYAQSPTTSHGHSGSIGSTHGHRSTSSASHARRRSSTSQTHPDGASGFHGRGPSDFSISGHRRKGSTSSSRSVRDRPPTPPPGSGHRRKASIASSREAGPIPDLPSTYSRSTLPPSSSTGSRLSVSGPPLEAPASPSLGSLLSSHRSSHYANSFLDYYARDDYDDEPLPASDSARSGLAGAPSEGEVEGDHGDRTFQADEASGEHDGEIVWQVLDDLRNNRLSILSKDSSLGFDSRDSSFEVDHAAGETSTDRANSIANLLRHRDRKKSDASLPPFQAGGRFPSIYVRDEQKLLALGQHGGVAGEQEGRFFVRPKEFGDAEDVAPPLPPMPQDYRDVISRQQRRHEDDEPHQRPF